MNYGQLNVIFLALALGVFLAAVLRRGTKRRPVAAVVVTMVVLVALTAVFDNVMIGSGLFDYAGHTIAGTKVGLAPIEDFAYPVAAALLLPGLWTLFSHERPK